MFFCCSDAVQLITDTKIWQLPRIMFVAAFTEDPPMPVRARLHLLDDQIVSFNIGIILHNNNHFDWQHCNCSYYILCDSDISQFLRKSSWILFQLLLIFTMYSSHCMHSCIPDTPYQFSAICSFTRHALNSLTWFIWTWKMLSFTSFVNVRTTYATTSFPLYSKRSKILSLNYYSVLL